MITREAAKAFKENGFVCYSNCNTCASQYHNNNKAHIYYIFSLATQVYFLCTHCRFAKNFASWTLLVVQPKLAHQTSRRASLLLLEDVQEALPDLPRLLAGVDLPPDARLLVVTDNRTGLLVVRAQPLRQGVGIVVAPLDQGLARDVVDHLLDWRGEDLVVAAAAGRVDETSCDAANEQVVVDLQLNGVLERSLSLVQHAIELLGLGDCAWESIEDEPVKPNTLVRRAP